MTAPEKTAHTLALVQQFLECLEPLDPRDVRLSLVDNEGGEHRWSLYLEERESYLAERQKEFEEEVNDAALRWGFQPHSVAYQDRNTHRDAVRVYEDLTRIEDP